MAVTIEWVRDNYDKNKDRYIDNAEVSMAEFDWAHGTIDNEQMSMIQFAWSTQTLLPAYDAPAPVCTPGDKRCRDANTVEQCRADGSGWDVVQTCGAGFECKIDKCVATPTTDVTLLWVRDHYDNNPKNRRIDDAEASMASFDKSRGTITQAQLDAVEDAWSKQTLLPAYDEPAPPPNMETRTVSLTEGQHTIQVSFTGYDTLNATINVSSTGVACVSVIGGACGGSSLPRISTSGWTVTTYLKSGVVTTNRCTWIATKDTSKVAFISEMVLAYNNLANIGFTPSASEISQAVLMYAKLGTPASLWGC